MTPNVDLTAEEILRAALSLAGGRTITAYVISDDGITIIVPPGQRIFFPDIVLWSELARLNGQAYLAHRTQADIEADEAVLALTRGAVRHVRAKLAGP